MCCRTSVQLSSTQRTRLFIQRDIGPCSVIGLARHCPETRSHRSGCTEVIPLRDRLLAQYGDQVKDTSTLAKMVGTNTAYAEAKTPVIRTKRGVMPAANHRVVLDDIGWGLCALVSIAERLESAGIHTPTSMMRMLIEWHQKMMGKEFLLNGKLRGRDCEDLVLLRLSDDLQLVAKPPGGGDGLWLQQLVDAEEAALTLSGASP